MLHMRVDTLITKQYFEKYLNESCLVRVRKPLFKSSFSSFNLIDELMVYAVIMCALEMQIGSTTAKHDNDI